MRSRPEVSDQEIQQYMNFEKLLLEKAQLLKRKKIYRMVKTAGIATGVVVVASFIWILNDNNSKNQISIDTQQINKDQNERSPRSEQLNVPQAPGSNQTDSVTHPIGSLSSDGPREHVEPASSDGAQPEKKAKKQAPRAENKDVQAPPSAEAYVQASPVNGYPDLYEYFQRELRYPEDALQDSIQGVVSAVFTINTSGKAENIQVENSLGPAFDKEVTRVLQNMPLWNPATYNGTAIKSKISIPLTFKVEKVDDNQ